MKLGLTAFWLLAASAVTTLALADDPQPDSVFLRDGTAARGHVAEMIAYDHVTIVLPRGERKRIPWAEVEHVLVGSQSPFGPPPPTPTPTLTEPDRPTLHVHFTATETTFLYREPEGTTDWITVCASPCDADVPVSDHYRVGGNGNPTKDVQLAGAAGETITLHVDGRNHGALIGGWLLMGLGSMVGVAALSGGNDENSESAGKRALILSAVGVAVLVTGILVYVKAAKTDVTQKQGIVKEEAHVRRPMWRSLTAVEQSTPPPTFPVLYEGRF